MKNRPAMTSLPVLEDAQAQRDVRSKRALPIADVGCSGSDNVLSTLKRDGTRRWLRPKLAQGRWWHSRRAVAYLLMVIFVVVPYIRIAGKPLIQLDITARQFTIFGYTFLPTDTLLLALVMLAGFITIAFVTAVTGRAWCGWACPQTVYMEYLFRPLDRLFEGTTGKGGKPKQPMSAPRQIARFAVYILLSMFLAHTFLAYFVGPQQLAQWIRSSPFEHPVAFLVMASTTGLLAYDFFYFREQTCLIACPYGRLQSVMLDPQSLIVAYDYNRGEPRKKGKHLPTDNAGDCVDCHQCVVVCPTGIDIRDGLQMECINCTQCIDACDDVMDKVGYPRGLIRYTSEDALEHRPPRLLRARTIAYGLILAVVLTGMGYALSLQGGFDARVIRGKGAPFTSVSRGLIYNTFFIRLVNRTDKPQSYTFNLLSPAGAELEVIDESGLQLEPGQMKTVPLGVRFSSSLTFGSGNAPITLTIVDSHAKQQQVAFRLIGPRQ